jgi:hypothetical protein
LLTLRLLFVPYTVKLQWTYIHLQFVYIQNTQMKEQLIVVTFCHCYKLTQCVWYTCNTQYSSVQVHADISCRNKFILVQWFNSQNEHNFHHMYYWRCTSPEISQVNIFTKFYSAWDNRTLFIHAFTYSIFPVICSQITTYMSISVWHVHNPAEHALGLLCLSICLNACNNLRTTRQIFMKWRILWKLIVLFHFPFIMDHFIACFTWKFTDVPVYISPNMYQSEKCFEQKL